jgi:hypothetical protein
MPEKPSKTKTRNTAFVGTMKDAVSKIRITFDPSAESFEIEGADPSSYYQEVFYERASGNEKVVVRQPAHPNQPAEIVNPETIGWHLVLREHIRPSTFSAKERVGLVVDSELGKLMQINERSEPYYRGHLLPKNVGLIYASTDATSGSLPGAMIKACDTVARLVGKDLTTWRAWPEMMGQTPDCDGYFCVEC